MVVILHTAFDWQRISSLNHFGCDEVHFLVVILHTAFGWTGLICTKTAASPVWQGITDTHVKGVHLKIYYLSGLLYLQLRNKVNLLEKRYQ